MEKIQKGLIGLALIVQLSACMAVNWNFACNQPTFKMVYPPAPLTKASKCEIPRKGK